MKLCVVVAIALLVVVANATETTTPCNAACPDIYDPICASNGSKKQTFPSDCDRLVYNCQNNENYTTEKRGRC
ncbi:hypothetical protein C0J52_25821 [Blattella germanica]|nr:hypothetical protein C0J52_25821 [Blattella germanica]